MCRHHAKILDYISEIVREIKDDILLERYADAKAKVEAVAELLVLLDKEGAK